MIHMKKIHLIREKSSKFGGAEVYVSRLSKALKDEGIEHQIVNSIFPSFLPSWLRIILFNLQVFLTKKDKFYFSLERIICPDVYRAGDGVHKVFLTIENKSKINPLHPIYLFLEKRCFNNSKHIIANSQMIKDQIIQVYGIDSKKISVVYNGIKGKEINYQKSYEKLSKEFSITKDQPILLYVGSGFKRKGVKEFLQIIANLEVINLKAFVIGKEKNIEYYHQLVQELDIEGRVIFTGAREDVDDFYTISDVFLFPTHYEPFSNVVLEAMSFDNAVFTTTQNGAHEILQHDYVMTSPTDYSIVKKIELLLENSEALGSIKDQNRLKSQQFSIEKNMQKTLEIINGVMSD